MRKRNIIGLILVLFMIVPFLTSCSKGPDYATAQVNDPWVYKGVSINDNDTTLRHYVWEKVRPPYGPWDKIQLHRYVKETSNPDCIPGRAPANAQKVLFFNPGTWDRAIHATQDNLS